MCVIKGVRVHCACKDSRCRNRRDFVDRDAQGNVIRHAGHGWCSLKKELVYICGVGWQLLQSGQMKFVDVATYTVEDVVPHAGVTVEWEVMTSSNHTATICDDCRNQKHKVS